MPRIAVLPGEGVGPEIVREALKVLRALNDPSCEMTFEFASVGGVAFEKHGHPLPEDATNLARTSDAVLFGTVGDPRFDHLDRSLRPERAILGLRQELGLFASFKHVTVPAPLAEISPLRSDRVSDLDLLVVRELNGDVYTGRPRGVRTCPDGPFAGEREGFDTMRYAEGEIRRIARSAFTAARERRGQVTSVDKANVLETSRVWRDVVTEVATEFPDVALTHMFADFALMRLVSEPKSFDVIVTANLFGDLISDVAGALSGSIGLCGSALLGSDQQGMFEAGHGSALDIAGRNVVNPVACIRAGALMMRHSLRRPDLAERVETAIQAAMQNGWRTDDIMQAGMRRASTSEMGDAIAAALH